MARGTGRLFSREARRWAALVDAQASSGMTQVEFCLRRGISVHLLRSWKYKRLRTSTVAEVRSPQPARFVEVCVAEERRLEDTQDSGVSLELATGHCVRVATNFDPETLRRVVAAIGRVRC